MAITARIRLRHPGTGRKALIVARHNWLDDPAVTLRGAAYVLVAAHQRTRAAASETAARRWIDAGASHLCAWGPSADDTEKAFDRASFLEAIGKPLTFTLMTTSHARESLEEALWFAFYNATPPKDLRASLGTVMVVVDKPALAAACARWIRLNRE